MRSLQLYFGILNASFHFALESSRSGSIFGSGIEARAAQKLCFCSYQFKNVRRKRRSEDAGTSCSSPDHCPDVAGKSTYSMVDPVVLMSSGILLSEECRFFERGRHFLPVGDFDSGNRPPAVGRTHFNNTGR
ncbi:hypothetical protein EVAR_58229_1 [Eumeta japonica]|uniref:Uncharacterized protein n=1 Tax=Eumeta variegata TaxID=151549 RepID=A0A4C2AGD4_EUMVA|nr:hypothetical protein EVAR_58229_1 [Eumeta japonica]